MNATSLSDAPRRSGRRPLLAVIVALGVCAIAASVLVRNSSWARERRLKDLSLEELALAVHDSPNDSLTFYYYGSALLKAGKPEASEQAFRRATHLDPRLEKAHLGLGSALFDQTKYKSAAAEFEQAAKLDPKDPDAYLGLARSYNTGGASKYAVAPLKKLTELKPSDPESWYALGVVYGNTVQWDDAYAAIRKACALDGSKADYWRSLGQISVHYNRLADAEAQFQKSVALAPDYAPGYLLLGQTYMKMTDSPEIREKARQALKAAMQRAPDLQPAYLEMGRLYERQGDYPTALTYLDRACDLDASDDQALYHRGICEQRTGNTAQGDKDVKLAQELGQVKTTITSLENRCAAEPQNRDLRLRLARTYRKYGNLEGAMQVFDMCARMSPPDAALQAEMASLRQDIKKYGGVAGERKTGGAPNKVPR